MGDRQPVSKADEFEAILIAADKPNDWLQSTRNTMIADWVRPNQDLIARALRRDAAIEKTGDFLIPLDKAVGEEIARWEQPLRPRHYVDFVLQAFREAVK